MTLNPSGALPVERGDDPAAEDRLENLDPGAELHELYRRHSAPLVRRLAHRTGCHETARDLVHEAFLRLARLASGERSRIRQPEFYLKRISTNLLRDWARWPSRRQAHPEGLSDLHAGPVDQVAVLESRDTLRRLEAAMAKLKPRTREIFLAHRLDGLSYAEIAERTGISVSAVEKHMIKAIAKIDRFLDRP